MGFSLRKKVKLGKNTSLNLSGSGISFSTGKKGARVVHGVLGKRAGRTTLYGQKRIMGTDVRYIKSFGGGKRGRPSKKEKTYDFEDFDNSDDVMDFDDYLGQRVKASSNPSASSRSDPLKSESEDKIKERDKVSEVKKINKQENELKQNKNKTTAALFALFLGGVGVHKFYLGNTGIGVLYLLFSWTLIPAIIGIIEGIILFSMSEEKFNEKYCQ